MISVEHAGFLEIVSMAAKLSTASVVQSTGQMREVCHGRL